MDRDIRLDLGSGLNSWKK